MVIFIKTHASTRRILVITKTFLGFQLDSILDTLLIG